MTTLAGACLGHASPIASREEVVEALEHIYHTCGDGYEAVASRGATSGLVHSLHLVRTAHASEKDTARLDLGSFLSRGLFVNAQRLMEKYYPFLGEELAAGSEFPWQTVERPQECSPAFIAVAQGGTSTQWLLCALAAGLTPPPLRVYLARCRMLMAGDLRPLEFLLVSPLGMALGLGLCTECSILWTPILALPGHATANLPVCAMEAPGPDEATAAVTMALEDVRTAGLCLHSDPPGPLFCRWLRMGTARLAQTRPVPLPLVRCPGILGHRDFLYFLEPLVGVPAGMLGITDAAGQDLEVDNPRHFTRMDKMRRGDLAMVCYARECGWRLDGCVGWEPYMPMPGLPSRRSCGTTSPFEISCSGRYSALGFREIRHRRRRPARRRIFVSYLVGRELRAQFREMLVSDMEHATATSPRWLVDMMWYGAAPWPWQLVTVIARHMLMAHYQYVGWLLAAGADPSALRHRATVWQPACGEEAAVMPKHRAAHQGVRAWGSEGTITVYPPDGGLVFSVEDPVLHKDLEWAAAALVGYAPQWGRLIQCLPNGDGFTNDPSGIIVRGCYQLILVNPMDGGTAIERQTFIRDSLLQDDPLSLTRAVELADGFARCWVWGSQLCPVVWALDQPVVVLIRVLEIMRGRAMPGGDRLRTALELEPVHNALLTAVKSGSVATVYELLVAGSPPDRRTLHFALLDAVGYTAPLAVTRLLLCARADPGFEQGDDEGDETPFGLAVYNRMWDTVRLFLCNSIAHRPAEWLCTCMCAGDVAICCSIPATSKPRMEPLAEAPAAFPVQTAVTGVVLQLQRPGHVRKWEALGAGLNIPHHDILQVSSSGEVDAPFVQFAQMIAALYNCNCVVIEASRRMAWLKSVPGDPREAASGIPSYRDVQGHHGYQAFYHN
ncbi:unnamed protein product [Symbiodinium sp. CCMP2592]|nr:unnamed protein product [Symbiodinium sp. CCMP2592]